MLTLGHFTAFASIVSAKRILEKKKKKSFETINALFVSKIFTIKEKKLQIVSPNDNKLGNWPRTGCLKEIKKYRAHYSFELRLQNSSQHFRVTNYPEINVF